jgi:hypothetical protein
MHQRTSPATCSPSILDRPRSGMTECSSRAAQGPPATLVRCEQAHHQALPATAGARRRHASWLSLTFGEAESIKRRRGSVDGASRSSRGRTCCVSAASALLLLRRSAPETARQERQAQVVEWVTFAVLPMSDGRAVPALALRLDRHAPGAGAALVFGVAEPALALGAEAAQLDRRCSKLRDLVGSGETGLKRKVAPAGPVALPGSLSVSAPRPWVLSTSRELCRVGAGPRSLARPDRTLSALVVGIRRRRGDE